MQSILEETAPFAIIRNDNEPYSQTDGSKSYQLWPHIGPVVPGQERGRLSNESSILGTSSH